jgi:hypothetical protein
VVALQQLKREAQAALEPDIPGAAQFAAQSCAETELWVQSEPRDELEWGSVRQAVLTAVQPVAQRSDVAVLLPESAQRVALGPKMSGVRTSAEQSDAVLASQRASAAQQRELWQLELPQALPV